MLLTRKIYICAYETLTTMNITININAPIHNLTIVNDDKEAAKELAKSNEMEEKVGEALLKVLNSPLKPEN